MARIVYTDSSNREFSVYLGPDQPVVSIGRATDCTIRSNRKSVSRHHAEFRYNSGTFEIIDLDSSNGTWLIENEQRFEIAHERLEDQDEIWCGDFIVHFLLDDAAEDAPPAGAVPPSQEQQYVSGPTEAADAVAFGAAPSEMTPEQPGGLSQHSSVAFDHDHVEELGADDLVEIGDRADAADHEVERLREEKQSIEDLASRQAFEIEELQAELQQASQRLEQAHAQLEQARLEHQQAGNTRQLEAQLEQALSDVEALRGQNNQLRQQLDSNTADASKLEALRAELDNERQQLDELRAEFQRTDDDLADTRRRLERAQNSGSALERQLAEKNARIEALEHDVHTLEAELSKASSSGDDVERMGEQLDQMRAKLEKSNRLLDEYERRNAELRGELDEQREVNDELRQTAARNEAKLAELFDAREALQREASQADRVREELEQTRGALEAAEQLNTDLNAELQGLKQRLKLERRRADEDASEELERLEAQLVEATERIAEIEQERDELADRLADTGEAGGADDEQLSEAVLADLRRRLSTLERLADAIDRTDLAPLSTVDRIRLQSAIRETTPKQTLQDALDLLSK